MFIRISKPLFPLSPLFPLYPSHTNLVRKYTIFDRSRTKPSKRLKSSVYLYQQVKVKNEQGLGLTHLKQIRVP